MMCYSLYLNSVCKIKGFRANFPADVPMLCNYERCLGKKINLSDIYIHGLKVVFYMSTQIAVSLILWMKPVLKRLSRLKIILPVETKFS